MYPGNASGTNWGSAAFDAARQLLVLNTARLATLVQLVPRDSMNASRAANREVRAWDDDGRAVWHAPEDARVTVGHSRAIRRPGAHSPRFTSPPAK